ncbi:MAG: DUF1572 family protein [Bacteroidota bacterium]
MASMIANNVSEIIVRDLQKLAAEVSAFKNQENLWKVEGSILNSSGNLVLHLCGNLQHFIGAVLGNSGYIRNRDAEFAQKNISREMLLKEIEVTVTAVKNGMSLLTDEELYKEYPLEKWNQHSSKAFLLIHLTAHLNYHLGQINYLRRVLEK